MRLRSQGAPAGACWALVAVISLLGLALALGVDGSPEFYPSPSPMMVPEASLSCAPIATGHSDDVRIQRVTLVATHEHRSGSKKGKGKEKGERAATTSFLFRGALPDNEEGFLHKRLLREMRAAVEAAAHDPSNTTHTSGSKSSHSGSSSTHSPSHAFPSRDADVYLIDVNLMWLSKSFDAHFIESEYEWFTMRTDQHTRIMRSSDGRDELLQTDAPGEFHLWETYGTHNNASEEYFDEPSGQGRQRKRVSRNAEAVEQLREGKVPRHWSVPDRLDERVEALQHWLRHKRVTGTDGRARTVVIYVHCFCGVDRTGEMMGAWALAHAQPQPSFAEVNRRNTAIGGRHVECRNYRALQWYCLMLEGQKKSKLECQRNLPCTEFI